jgi:hypothetical protein
MMPTGGFRSGTVQYINILAAENDKDAAKRFYLPLSYTDPFGSITSVTYYKDYHLLIQKTKDALDNAVSVEDFDFRTLSSKKIKDVNGNFAAVAIDTLGLVVGTAIMGKGEEADDLNNFATDLSPTQIHDFFADPFAKGRNLLQHATSRLIYDFTKIPCSIGTVLREEHHSINSNPALQYGFEYSGGLGNIVLKKIQAEPGDAPHRDLNGKLVKKADGELDLKFAPHRWVGNGRTILNNKGKPVKQYEPYFSDSHLYEIESELRETGVTATLHYDAAGRLVKTIMPDETFSKVEYDSWMQKTYDANDTTILVIDGIKKESDWYTDRVNHNIDGILIKQGKDPVKEKEAAEKAAVHANTPSVVHTDSLGRTFYTVAHNKFSDFAGGAGAIKEEFYATQAILDIESNLRSVIDARNNTVMQYKYDMLGNMVYQNSMDAGERWMLNDSMGKPVFVWDSKDQLFETTYDNLHRPLTQTLTNLLTVPQKVTIIEESEYVDTKGLTASDLTTQQAKNLVGKAITHYDSAGIARSMLCDFKGNTLENSRQLCQEYKAIPDWTIHAAVGMEEEVFVSKSEFDALNRPVKIFSPSTSPATTNIKASEITPIYNEANLLNKVQVKFPGAATATDFVKDINYDAKGQRESIIYGNNVKTNYTYDKYTFRLIKLFTIKKDSPDALQDLNYTYDPVGNITFMRDDAHQTTYFGNKKVEPEHEYIYDAIYRLTQATGREHIGQNVLNETNTNTNIRNFPFNASPQNIPSIADTVAMRNYTQKYTYDEVGNIKIVDHNGHDGNGFTRNYFYNNNDTDRTECNVAGNAMKNNQLLRTQIKNVKINYNHDAHGNMTTMPHLVLMQWNFKDQLQATQQTAGGIGETTWYIYDATGQRVRKITERQGSTSKKNERIYLNGFEIYRSYKNDGTTVELQRETLHIMDDKKGLLWLKLKPLTMVVET